MLTRFFRRRCKIRFELDSSQPSPFPID